MEKASKEKLAHVKILPRTHVKVKKYALDNGIRTFADALDKLVSETGNGAPRKNAGSN